MLVQQATKKQPQSGVCVCVCVCVCARRKLITYKKITAYFKNPALLAQFNSVNHQLPVLVGSHF